MIDDARELLVKALRNGLEEHELEKALEIIGGTAFREELLHRLQGINDHNERAEIIDEWSRLARLCKRHWNRKDFSRQTHVTLGIGGGGGAIVAAFFAAISPATAPFLVFGIVAGASTAARSFFIGQSLTDEMTVLQQIGDAIMSVIEEAR